MPKGEDETFINVNYDEHPPNCNCEMSKFFIPTENPDDWKNFLDKPNRQWKSNHSAKAMAYNWQEAGGFPIEIKKVFRESGFPAFKGINMLMAFPEYKVPLPGGGKASQNDIFVLAKSDNRLISIAVEGKADEPFGEVISEWKTHDMGGKKERLEFICALLKLSPDLVDDVYYQLLHRIASAVIKAQEFNATIALMLVHVFKKTPEKYEESFQAYCKFLNLFDKKGRENSITSLRKLGPISLYSGWVEGNKKYLEV